jgi:hypothetical protein
MFLRKKFVLQNNLLQYLVFALGFFAGCDTHYNAASKLKTDFTLSPQTSLSLQSDCFPLLKLQSTFEEKGFHIDENASLHVRIESSCGRAPACALNAVSSKEEYLRFSVYDAANVYYKIQMNRCGTIQFDDVIKMIEKMKEEVVK